MHRKKTIKPNEQIQRFIFPESVNYRALSDLLEKMTKDLGLKNSGVLLLQGVTVSITFANGCERKVFLITENLQAISLSLQYLGEKQPEFITQQLMPIIDKAVEILLKFGRKIITNKSPDGTRINIERQSLGSYIISQEDTSNILFKMLKSGNYNYLKKNLDDALMRYITDLEFANAEKILNGAIRHNLTMLHSLNHNMKILNLHRIIFYGSDLSIIEKFINVCRPNFNTPVILDDGGYMFLLAEVYKSEITNKFEIIKLLLENGADPNILLPTQVDYQPHKTLLIECVEEDNIEVAELLISKGADVNFLFTQSVHPRESFEVNEYPAAIASALANQNRAMIKLLLKSGSKLPFIFDREGNMHVCVTSKKETYKSDMFVEEMLKLIYEAIIEEVGLLPLEHQVSRAESVLIEDAGTAPGIDQPLTQYASAASLDRGEDVTSVSAARDPILTLSAASQEVVRNMLKLYKQINNQPTIDSQIKTILFEVLSNNGSQQEKRDLLNGRLSELSAEHPVETSAAIISIAHSLDQKIVVDTKHFILTLATDPRLIHQYCRGQLQGILQKEQSSTCEEPVKWIVGGETITPSTPHLYEISSDTKDKFFVYFSTEVWDANTNLLSKLDGINLHFIGRGSKGQNGVKISSTNIAKLKLIKEGEGGKRFTSDTWIKNANGETLIVFNKDHAHDAAYKYARKKKGEYVVVPHGTLDADDAEQCDTSGNNGNGGGGGGVHGKTASFGLDSTKSDGNHETDIIIAPTSSQGESLGVEEENNAIAIVAYMQGVSASALKYILQNNEVMGRAIQKIVDALVNVHKTYGIADRIAEVGRHFKLSLQDKVAEDTQKSTDEEDSQPPMPSISSDSGLGDFFPIYYDPLSKYLPGKNCHSLSGSEQLV